MPRHSGPSVVVDPPVSEHLEVLGTPFVLCVGIVEGVPHRRTLDRLLPDPSDVLGLRDPGRVEHGGQDIDDVVELVPDLPERPDPCGPVHDEAVAGAAEVRGDLLGPLVRRVHRKRPADRVHRKGRRVPDAVYRCMHLRDVVCVAVPDEMLPDGALEATLPRGAVVAQQVEHQGVLEDAELSDRIHQAPHLAVGVLGEAGVRLHEPRGDTARRWRQLIPVRHLFGPRCELGVRRDHPLRLLPGQCRHALRVPAAVEPTGVLLDPLGGDVERCMGGAEREVGEERPVGGERALRAHPVDAVVDEVLSFIAFCLT